jgi:hypothetical protein
MRVEAAEFALRTGVDDGQYAAQLPREYTARHAAITAQKW